MTFGKLTKNRVMNSQLGILCVKKWNKIKVYTERVDDMQNYFMFHFPPCSALKSIFFALKKLFPLENLIKIHVKNLLFFPPLLTRLSIEINTQACTEVAA